MHLKKEVDGGDDEIWNEIRAMNCVRGDPGAVMLHYVFAMDYFIQITMEFLRGGNLTQRIIQRGRFSEDCARGVIKRIGGALLKLHSAGECSAVQCSAVQCSAVQCSCRPMRKLCAAAGSL